MPKIANAFPQKPLPYLALMLGILSLAMSAIFVRWADAPGPITAFYRVSISIILLTPFFLRGLKKQRALPKKIWLIPLWGGIFTALDFAFWNTAVTYTTAANATLLGNTAPLWVALGAWLIFREKLSKRFWFGLMLALSGAALIVGTDFLTHFSLGFGDILALIAGIFYGGYFLITQRGRVHFDPLTYTWVISLFAAMGLLLINIALGHSFTGYEQKSWLAFLGAGIISQTLGYLSLSYALGHLPASVVSPSMIGQPVMTTIFAIPMLGEIPQIPQLLGGSIALVGIYLVNRAYQKGKKDETLAKR